LPVAETPGVDEGGGVRMIDQIICGDCLEELPAIPEDSIDAIVTDPPYELAFMGKKWDGSGISYNIDMWSGCLRVLKPGGHLLAFGGTRTYHRMACAIEDAGFEIRDCLEWVYGSGFPKSLDISKAIDKHGGQSVSWFGSWLRRWREENGITQKDIAALFPSKTGNLTGCVANWELNLNMPTCEQFNLICKTYNLPFRSLEEAEREVIGKGHRVRLESTVDICGRSYGEYDITAPATPAAKQWAGWGSALKPAHEPIILARKPPEESTIAANVLKWGVGGLNIDACRIGQTVETWPKTRSYQRYDPGEVNKGTQSTGDAPAGRFPSNLIWSHSPLCKRIGTKKVKGSQLDHVCSSEATNGIYHPRAAQRKQGYTDADGLEEVETWDCHPSCPSWEFAKAGETRSGAMKREVSAYEGESTTGFLRGRSGPSNQHGDSGSVSRFFKSCQFTEEDLQAFVYVAKASRAERDNGLIGKIPITKTHSSYGEYAGTKDHAPNSNSELRNRHPTVKPLELMKYLVRLVTPPNGIILDPFAGSGTTLLAAKQEGFRFIGIEKEAEYHEIARKRIAAVPARLDRWAEATS
jgi:DNA modification methylase